MSSVKLLEEVAAFIQENLVDILGVSSVLGRLDVPREGLTLLKFASIRGTY